MREVLGEVEVLYSRDLVVGEVEALQIDAALQPFYDFDLLVAEIHVRKSLEEVLVLLLPDKRSSYFDYNFQSFHQCRQND